MDITETKTCAFLFHSVPNGDSGYPLRRTMMIPILDAAPDTPDMQGSVVCHYTTLHPRLSTLTSQREHVLLPPAPSPALECGAGAKGSALLVLMAGSALLVLVAWSALLVLVAWSALLVLVAWSALHVLVPGSALLVLMAGSALLVLMAGSALLVLVAGSALLVLVAGSALTMLSDSVCSDDGPPPVAD
ncbi:Uncharacterized protein OBRU01_03942 [Operophtera brumata]|uniref:Uncharacterized protein n=1 Tax=Operophtera brumata TaxID=104452 RepID=A0A0L7LFU2_OPEBR|nr:Uncharacterized protein OBRU01_03942 [Operophtera brumata]